MKVRITTQHQGDFDAELDEGMTIDDLFHGEGSTVSFTANSEFDTRVRVTTLRKLILVVEEDL